MLRGAEREGIATLEISKRMIHRDPGMTRLLGKLQLKKLVIRTRSGEDRRKVMCVLSETTVSCHSLPQCQRKAAQILRSFLGPQNPTSFAREPLDVAPAKAPAMAGACTEGRSSFDELWWHPGHSESLGSGLIDRAPDDGR